MEDYKWQLELWQNENGSSPVERFLKTLKARDNIMHLRVLKQINKLRKRPVAHLLRTGDIENLKNGLHELKITVPKGEIRFFGIIQWEDQTFSIYNAIHVYQKKTNRISLKEMQTALVRLAEYNEYRK